MTDRKVAAAQIARFSGLPGFPTETVAISELITALAEASHNQEHAKATADHYLANNRFAPTPFDLRDASRAAMRPEWATPPLQTCLQCVEGWLQIDDGGSGYVIPCDCEAGRARGKR